MQERALAALVGSDERTREKRAERLVWVSQFKPIPSAWDHRMEPLQLLEEARVSYIWGQFVATVLCATSYIEQVLSDELELGGHARPFKFEKLIQAARDAQVVPSSVLDAVDKLRIVRNPFCHWRDDDDADRIGARMKEQQKHPSALLEGDAQLAIGTMYDVFWATLRPRPTGQPTP